MNTEPQFNCLNKRYFIKVKQPKADRFIIELHDVVEKDKIGEITATSALDCLETMTDLIIAYHPPTKVKKDHQPYGGRVPGRKPKS